MHDGKGRGDDGPTAAVAWGDLRRTTPFSRVFGLDRGRCIDRYYIEGFLDAHRTDIRGRVLEVEDGTYTAKFGGPAVTRSDVLHLEPGARHATICADLARAEDAIASDAFDCIILTQTLQFIFDVSAAVRNLHRILAPGGVLLATVPGVSQISRYDMDRWGDLWRFTDLSARKALETAFRPDLTAVGVRGNVLACTAFLHGLAEQELTRNELDAVDPDYQLLLVMRAQKEACPA